MEQIHDRVAGLDVHRDSVAACVRVPGQGRRVVTHNQRFATTTHGLAQLGAWLAGHIVTVAGMEATGVYWKPVSYALEDRFELLLCNAHHVKNVPGRRTDMSDAVWLAGVVAHGMVRASFVPPPPVRELRDLTRYRKRQIDTRIAGVQRLEKVLQDAGIKLSSLASEVLSKSGRRMLEALIAAQRDPAVLAEMALGKMRIKRAALGEALAGHFAPHHAVTVRQVLDHVDFLDATITVVSEHVATRMEPFAAATRLLVGIPGISRTSAETIIAETGGDMSRFPSPAHLASWAGLCPSNHESAGQRRRVGTTNANRWLRPTLLESAPAAARTKGSYVGAQYRQIAHRRGPNKAAVAAAHSLIRRHLAHPHHR
jgi:transposase